LKSVGKASVSPALFDISEPSTGHYRIRFNTDLTVDTAAGVLKHLKRAFRNRSPRSLTVDLQDVAVFDDYGALVIAGLKQRLPPGGDQFELLNPSPQAQTILRIGAPDRLPRTPPPPPAAAVNPIVRIGESGLEASFHLRYMMSFLGSVILAFFHTCLHPRSLRVDDTLRLMEKTGVQALPIVALISFLLGLVIAFMSSLQLKQFGANIYVASLVSIAMVSELGPIMTAIVVAGRSGSAFAAEIGTMRISDEIDALFLMGFAPTHFLAVPRIVAAIIVVPLLTLFADVAAIAGGLVVGIFILDLTFSSYIAQTLKALNLFEIFWGLSKSVVFAAIVAWIGCLRGFQTRGGADAVGNAATSAVVTSIFFIILVDSIFAVTRSYL
jgi:phospholipid/cholesterol/gamma-HCH transport system permease protein